MTVYNQKIETTCNGIQKARKQETFPTLIWVGQLSTGPSSWNRSSRRFLGGEGGIGGTRQSQLGLNYPVPLPKALSTVRKAQTLSNMLLSAPRPQCMPPVQPVPCLLRDPSQACSLLPDTSFIRVRWTFPPCHLSPIVWTLREGK